MTVTDRIENKWKDYPVKLKVLEIKDRSELPRWEDCKKDELYIGIKKNGNKDTVYVIRHQMEAVFNLKCSFDRLSDAELSFMGVYPSKSQFCRICGEFSTRINKDGSCCDCLEKLEKKEENHEGKD